MKSAILKFVGWYICSISSVVSVFVCNDIINEIEERYISQQMQEVVLLFCVQSYARKSSECMSGLLIGFAIFHFWVKIHLTTAFTF